DRRLPRRYLEFLDVPLDVLDHDDRIVDHDAGREDDPEQRQRVDVVAHQLDERERADQRYGDGDRRDQRAAPGLQEDEDDDDHQDDGLDQRLQHFADRVVDDLRRV